MCDRRSSLGRELALHGVLLALVMVRNCAAGLAYWPQLDDYIQHHNYASQFTFSQLQDTVGVLASRPLAGLADYYLWSPLFDRMIWGVVLMSLLYVAAIWMAEALIRRYFPLGPVFPVVMALLPLGVEGTYWMSASTRVVCGLFFACLAALAFGRWLDDGGWGRALAFLALMTVPFGFYEQSAVLAMTLVLGMAVLEGRRRWKRGLLALWALPAAGLYFAVTGLLSNGGVYGNRAQLFLPNQAGYWTDFFPNITGQIWNVLGPGSWATLSRGFLRGLEMVCREGMFLWAVLAAALCLLYGWLAARRGGGEERPRTALALAVGALLAAAPLTVFLILANPWFSFRGAVTSFVGLALMADTFVAALWRRLPGKRVGPAALSALLALVFCVAGASEIRDYRDTWAADQQAARAVLDTLDRDLPEAEDRAGLRVGVLGLEPTFLPDQNFRWHEHIHGCTESGWAFTGLLVSLAGGDVLPSVTPLPTDPIYRPWNAQVNNPLGFDVLYYYRDGALSRVFLAEDGTGGLLVTDGQGRTLGAIREENGVGRFQAF